MESTRSSMASVYEDALDELTSTSGSILSPPSSMASVYEDALEELLSTSGSFLPIVIESPRSSIASVYGDADDVSELDHDLPLPSLGAESRSTIPESDSSTGAGSVVTPTTKSIVSLKNVGTPISFSLSPTPIATSSSSKTTKINFPSKSHATPGPKSIPVSLSTTPGNGTKTKTPSSTKVKKASSNSLDKFFKNMTKWIRNFLDSQSVDEYYDFLTSWNSIRDQINQKGGRSRHTNCRRFFEHNGLELLLEAKEVVINGELRYLGLGYKLLVILHNLAVVPESRHEIFKDAVVDYLLEELESEDFQNVIEAAEILSIFLYTFGINEEDWTITNITIPEAGARIIGAMDDKPYFFGNQTKMLDKDKIYSQKDFEVLIEGIKVEGTHRAVKIMTLWLLVYFTRIDSEFPKFRKENAVKYQAWVGSTELLLRSFYTGEDADISNLAAEVLHNIGARI